MTTPTIFDLPTATIANNTDLLVMRQPGSALGTDKKVTIDKIRNLDLSSLAGLPTSVIASDLMLIESAGTNYQIPFQDVGFIPGTKMWFYHNVDTEIPGWTIVASTDNLLAVKGGTTYTTGGVGQGAWQQEDTILSIAQMPAHTHRVKLGKDGAGSSGSTNSTRRSKDPDNVANVQSQSTGGGLGHNHGDTWRPLASVGIICSKS